MALIELVFKPKNSALDAGEVHKRITKKLSRLDFSPYNPKLVSVTCMSKWLLALFDFPKISAERSIEDIAVIDSIAGVIVAELLEYTVRYCYFAVHGEGPSLVYK
jgi:hypothetical protein